MNLPQAATKMKRELTVETQAEVEVASWELVLQA